MFSVFKKNDVMIPLHVLVIGKNILEKSSTIEEMDMLRNFLGREPNSQGFLESVEIK
jgi:hypothetical protein